MLKKIIPIFMIITLNTFAIPSVNEILEEMESQMTINSDATARVKITQQKTGQGVREFESIYYRRDSDDSFLIVMTGPESERGNGYLRVGDNFWMYRRNTRTFQHINRDESIGGSDANAEDFENRKLTEMYKPATKGGKEIVSEEMLGKIPVYRFELEAKVEDVAYPKKTYWVRRDNYLPLKDESYALSGTLMQSGYFMKYTKIQGKYLSVKMMFVDEFEKGNRSIVEIENISLKDIENSVFTRAYLENLSR